MTIYFHPKHFMEHNLTLNKYFILLMHEDGETPSLKMMKQNTKLSERQCVRLRQELVGEGYLVEIRETKYELTEKFYNPNFKLKKAA